MRLIYLAIENPDSDSGVPRKIREQVNYLRKEGNEVKLIFIVYNFAINRAFSLEVKDHYWVLHVRTHKFPVISKLINRKNVFRALSLLISKEAFDFLYIRYPHYLDYPFYKFTKRFRKKLILESQTKEREELLLNRKYLKALFETLFKQKIFKNLYACIGVTEEITNYQKRFDKSGNVQFQTIGNGLNIDNVPIAKVSTFPQEELQLLYVGNVFPHHGVDRIIRGIANYKGDCRVSFVIAGIGSEIDELKKLVNHYNIESAVQFVGEKYGSELDAYFDRAHLGVGALGIHRKGLKESSVLKIRDYAARGFPFITSGRDSDFDDSPDIQYCYYKVPLDDSFIDIEEIIRFTRKLYGSYKDTFSRDLRNFSYRKTDMRIKMNELTRFLGK